MTYRGHIRNGVIVIDEPVELPEGAEVRVDVVPDKGGTTAGADEPTQFDVLKPFIGIASDLPSDFSVNHDHYLYGTPKRE